MKIEQIYTGCLAHGAYYIESNGEAAIIDPLREVQPYINKAESNQAKIKYIFETHFHADFVSGHIDLAGKTGATIVYGPTQMQTGFDAYVAKDNEIFDLGAVKIKLIHTPGHTLESSCLLLIDEQGKETALFTGDTVFIGDVGRPDLAQHVVSDLTQDKLARLLYHSIHHKILPLADDLIVYPAHGAGSACGKNLSNETFDTLGNQKKMNYALNPRLTEQEFVDQLLNGLTSPPSYFPKNVLLNINGYNSIDNILKSGTTPLSVEAFEAAASETGAIIIDTRNATNFSRGFIPNSINIGIDGSFAVWVGTLISDIKQPLLIVADEGRETEVVTRLARVGYDNTLGYLNGGIQAWVDAQKPLDYIENITPYQLKVEIRNKQDVHILDVRKQSEFDSQHLVEAINAPLDYINESMQMINKDKTYYVHCAGGYRSMIFISILKARGYHQLINVSGGFNEIKQLADIDITAYVCPTTML
jgi:hydroxyacylglutathione hydrolase